MKSRPLLSATRAAEIWTETLSVRRQLYTDSDFFKMPEVLDELFNASNHWVIKTYRTDETEDFKRKAGIVVLGDWVTLTADERLIERAKHGCKLSNFILAHEFGHLILNHHANSAITKNFQLFAGPNGMTNSPPTQEELEANYAGVFFQCGIALFESRRSALELARRAFSDVDYVKKAQAIVRLDAFQRELSRPKPKYERVIL